MLVSGTKDIKKHFYAGALTGTKSSETLIRCSKLSDLNVFASSNILFVAPPNILSPTRSAVIVCKRAIEKAQDFYRGYQKITTYDACIFLNFAGISQSNEAKRFIINLEKIHTA